MLHSLVSVCYFKCVQWKHPKFWSQQRCFIKRLLLFYLIQIRHMSFPVDCLCNDKSFQRYILHCVYSGYKFCIMIVQHHFLFFLWMWRSEPSFWLYKSVSNSEDLILYKTYASAKLWLLAFLYGRIFPETRGSVRNKIIGAGYTSEWGNFQILDS